VEMGCPAASGDKIICRMAFLRGKSSRMFLLITMAGFLLRLAAVIVLKSYEDPLLYEHGVIARNLLDGNGFSVVILTPPPRPTSQQTPLYPGLIAALWMVFGEGRLSMFLLQTLQAALGGLVCGFLYLLAEDMLGRTPGIWAGSVAAFYPPFIYTATHVQVVSLVLFFLAAASFCFWRGISSPRDWKWWAGGGILLGLGILTDPILMAVAPVFPGLLLLQTRDIKRSFQNGAIAAATVLLILSPWTIRNRIVHGRFVLVKCTFWYTFWQGNNEKSIGTDKLLTGDPESYRISVPIWDLKGTNEFILRQRDRTMPVENTLSEDFLKKLAPMSEIEKNEEMKKLALAFLRDHPDQYVHLCLNRLKFFLWTDPTNPKAYHPLYRGSYLLLVLLAAPGLIMVCLKHNWRAIVFCAAVAGTIAVVHILIIYAVRFRLPCEMFYTIFAGATVGAVLSFISRFIIPEARRTPE